MANGWDKLVLELVNKYDPKTSSHSVRSVCCNVAIYSKTGDLYASYPSGFKLSSYEHQVEQEDGSTKGVQVDEVKCAIAAS